MAAIRGLKKFKIAAVAMVTKVQNGHQIQKSSDLAKFGFQVDYDVANWYPSLVSYGGHFESKMAAKIQKSSDLGEIWFPSRLWCCELISIIGLLWRPFWIQDGRQNKQNPPIWAKFGFHVDVDVQNWYQWFGSHIMIHFVGISTVVCGSFWGLETIQNGAVAMVTKE